jgi:hypothetical protein
MQVPSSQQALPVPQLVGPHTHLATAGVPVSMQVGRVASAQALARHNVSATGRQRLVVLHNWPVGHVPWAGLPVHLQRPVAASQVSPVAQVTPLHGEGAAQTPLELQVWP